MEMNRRGFLRGLGATFIAAPAIVRASSLMAISAPKMLTIRGVPIIWDSALGPIWAELSDITRQAFMPSVYKQIFFVNPILSHLEQE